MCPETYKESQGQPRIFDGIFDGISWGQLVGLGVSWRARMALTDTKIRNAKPGAAAYRLTDTGGLYLQISPSGGKLWRWNYRYNGKQKTMPFGKYPEVTLAMVRERHVAARIELAKGNDPMAQRKAEKVAAKVQAELEKARDAQSFEAVALQWHKWWAAGVGSKTAAYIRRRLEADVFPVIGRKHVNEIKPADIRNLILTIERGEGQGRRFEGTGARDVAQRQHGTISQIYRYAIAHELADGNPAAAFRPGDVLSPRIPDKDGNRNAKGWGANQSVHPAEGIASASVGRVLSSPSCSSTPGLCPHCGTWNLKELKNG